MSKKVKVYLGKEIAAYGFPGSHPFSLKRHDAFREEFYKENLQERCDIQKPVKATKEELALFHTPDYIETVEKKSKTGSGYLDRGDTPVFPGVFEAASYVAGSVLQAGKDILKEPHAAFVPIAGLHHASRTGASGFCVFNDCGIVIEYLLQNGIEKIAYVDIDAHHGDGVYYAFEENPRVIFADIHESGRSLFPGTGYSYEDGKGEGKGYKLNIEMPPGAGDKSFFQAWETVENFVRNHKPDFILMQCGADSLFMDPLTHLEYSPDAHAFAAQRLRELSFETAEGRMLATGGGGYNLRNIAKAWTAVIKSML